MKNEDIKTATYTAILYVEVNNVECITACGKYIIQVPLITNNLQTK